MSNLELDKNIKIYEDLSKLLMNFYKYDNLIVKQATLLGEKRIFYCKGKDFSLFVKTNFDSISEEIKRITGIKLPSPFSEKALQTIYEILFERKLLLKLNRYEGDKAKYPKRLLPPKKGEDINTYEESKFYWLNLPSEKSKKPIVYLFISIIIVLLGCMFPVWPLKVKIGFLWFILIVLIFLLIITVLTLVVGIVGIIFGYDILLLPNLLEPKVSLRDRFFNPLIAYYPREDPWFIIFIRIFMGLTIVMVILSVFLFPQIYKYAFVFISNGCKNLYNYVIDKIIKTHNKTNTLSIVERTNKIIEDIP